MTPMQLVFLIILFTLVLIWLMFLWGYLLGRSDTARDEYIRGYLDGEASEDGR